MKDLNILIEQMAIDISTQAMYLEDVRLNLFLEWLNAHCIKMKAAKVKSLQLGQADVASFQEEKTNERLKVALKTLFSSLPMQGMLWEYRLILNEIAWWRDLDARRLAMILRSETGN